MLWIRISSKETEGFADLSGRLTIGSATSNSVVLEGKHIRPLHAQIRMEGDEVILEDFTRASTHSLLANSEISLGDFSLNICAESEFWTAYHAIILDSFREILKAQGSFDFSQAIHQLQKDIFFGRNIPTHLVDKLRSIHGEFELLGPMERLLGLESVSDVLVERFDRIWVEELGSLRLSSESFSSEEAYRIYIHNLLAKLQKSIDEVHPFLDFSLPDGSRGHLVGEPISPNAFYLSIRKPRSLAWTLGQLSDLGMIDRNQMFALQNALKEKKNILISGATGSGKTTLLKACLLEISTIERVIVLEDTPELKVDRMNTVYLQTRTDARSSLPRISLSELVRQSLRMRADRLVLGEVRSVEALDLLHAMNTGHQGCLGSLHANSSRDALGRLEGLIQMAEGSLSEVSTRDLISRNIYLILHCSKKEGIRKISEMAWVRGIDGDRILLEVLES